MKKLLLFIFPLLVCAETYAQARIPIKPIELRSRQIIATASGPEGFYVAHIIDKKDNLMSVGIRVWNGVFWANYTQLQFDTTSKIKAMIFDIKGQLHLGGEFVYQKGNDVFKNVIYFNNTEWLGYSTSEFFKPGQIINDFAFIDDSLAMFGMFDSIQGKEFNHILFVNKNNLEPVLDKNNEAGVKGYINKAVNYKNRLYLAGNFSVNSSPGINGIGYFEKGEWFSLHKDFSEVFNLTVLDNEDLMICGKETTSSALSFYKFDSGNNKWEPSNNGIFETVAIKSLVFYDQRAFATGHFVDSAKRNNFSLLCQTNNKWTPVNIFFESDIVDTAKGELYFISNMKSVNMTNLTSHRPFYIGSYKTGQKLIFGRLFVDGDKNCTYEPGEIKISQVGLRFGTDKNIFFTNDSGNFIYFFNDIENKKPQLINHQFNFNFDLCVEDSNWLSNIGQQDAFIGPVHIAVQPRANTVAKLKTGLLLLRGTQIAKGGRNTMMYTVQNTGLTEAGSIQIKFSGSNKLKNFQSDPPFTIINDSTVKWELNPLKPLEVSKIYFSYAVQDNVDVVNNLLDFNLNYEYFNGEETDYGTDSYQQEIVQNNDEPAFKKQSLGAQQLPDHASITQNDKEIQYQITFQNRLDETVSEVVIIDTIDLNHDFLYTQELGSSHHFTTQVIQDPNNPNRGFLIWTFANLSLTANPDALPEIISDMGFIKFKFVFNSLEYNEVIKNRAMVIMNGNYYFPTNQVSCIADNKVSVIEHELPVKNVLIYPNPASNFVKIAFSENQKESFQYKLMNVTGQIVLTGITEASEIDLTRVQNGIYFLTLSNGNTTYTQKLVVQKM
jgi:hypothetical protein